MDAPFPYYGGKTNIIGKLTPLVPLGFDTYLEPFCGSAAVFFAAPGRWAEVEILNDTNRNLYTFLRVCRDEYEPLAQLLRDTPFSRDFWREAKYHLSPKYTEPLSDMQRAYYWFVSIQQCHSGSGHSWRIPPKISTRPKTWVSSVEDLEACHRRLLQAILENTDAIGLMRSYDLANTVMYLDPPYLNVRSPKDLERAYSIQQKDLTELHQQIVDTCLSSQAAILLSGYDNPAYVPLEQHGWTRVSFTRKVSAKNTQGAPLPDSIECVWLNPRATQQRKLF